ncbi:hypothetical protein RhiirC2_784183 [Rhizophagus irregularis]|uniref:Uncharacterized protein n=1 Tax=Rhizophagus irregularis TaxID=588596 RepID=A0A2N1MZ69_9GLOM|nr:hypothetical protein RhiirC2_784183 [Rhizophagus irregularis]
MCDESHDKDDELLTKGINAEKNDFDNLSLDNATTSNDLMSIESSFVNEEISIDLQESISSSENLSTFSSKKRKRSRYSNTYLECDTQMQNINDSDDNNDNDVKQHTIQQHKAIKKCGHVQFPNHRSLRQCNAPLLEQKELDNGKVVNVPLLIYPMSSIKEQLLQMYQRPNFEKILNYRLIEALTTESYVIYIMVKFERISQIVE